MCGHAVIISARAQVAFTTSTAHHPVCGDMVLWADAFLNWPKSFLPVHLSIHQMREREFLLSYASKTCVSIIIHWVGCTYTCIALEVHAVDAIIGPTDCNHQLTPILHSLFHV